MEAETEAEMEYRSKQQDSNGKAERGSAKTGEQHQTYQSLAKATRFPERCRQLISVPRIRHATYAAVIVMISQQLCGVNVIGGTVSRHRYTIDQLIFCCSVLLVDVVKQFQRKFALHRKGVRSPEESAVAKLGVWLNELPVGTRTALTLLGAGFSFKISENSRAHIGVIAFFIILFAIFYSPGLGPVPFTLSAEVFPLINREVGMSFAVFWNLLGAGILSLTVPFLNDSLRATGLLCLFAGLNVVTFALVFFLVYETKSASLEEMNVAVETRTHIKYQLDYVLPWAYNRYIRRTKDEDPLDSLFIWAQNQQTARE
ncbi:MAG: hypothetical protein M1839_002868 [Geoglossum umbratile]|nr:MAG: hypothetical protein M1839_002868 [Geoglossum umbratile]